MTSSPAVRTAPHVELVNPDGRARALLLCDHAGREVPPELDGLGLGAEALARHIGWDIGAADLTRRLAVLLDAPAILNHCSRLVIDPNRRPCSPGSMPAVSDHSVVPANAAISPEEARRRTLAWFVPYHRTVARAIGRFRRKGIVPALIAIHSFTPRLNGEDRPWQIGVLWRDDRRLAEPVLAVLRARGDLIVGDNQPYSGLAEFGFTVEFHAQRTRLPHVMFEVRQDEIATKERAEAYAGIIAETLRAPLADPGLYTLFPAPPWDGPAHRPWRIGFGLPRLA